MTRSVRRKMKNPAEDPARDWVIETEVEVKGYPLAPGVECRIKGKSGRFVFLRKVTTDKGVAWLDFIGPPGRQWRSFREDKVVPIRTRKRAA